MADNLTRGDLIDALEAMLEGQLRAVRGLRAGTKPRRRRADGSRSNIQIVIDILSSAGEPLHVNEVILRARRDHGVELKRESIVSALTKKVIDGDTFRRTGRNVFSLIGREV
jgi:hypothetical protein